MKIRLKTRPVELDLIDRIGTVLFWLGLAILVYALFFAVFGSHPRALNHSVGYLALLGCGLWSFAVGGFTHLFGWGLKKNGGPS